MHGRTPTVSGDVARPACALSRSLGLRWETGMTQRDELLAAGIRIFDTQSPAWGQVEGVCQYRC